MASPEVVRNTERSAGTQSGGAGSSPVPPTNTRRERPASREQRVVVPRGQSPRPPKNVGVSSPGNRRLSSQAKSPGSSGIMNNGRDEGDGRTTAGDAGDSSGDVNGDEQGVSNVLVPRRVSEIERIEKISDQGPDISAAMNKGKGKSRVEDSEDASDDSDDDSVLGEVKEIERLLEGEAKRNAEFQEQVNRRKHNMDDINTRQAKLRKNLVSGTLTGAERQELLDAYETLERAYELAESVNARLAKKLTAASVEIRGLEKRLGEVTEALRHQKKKGGSLQMLLDGLQGRLEKTEAEREGYKRELETTKDDRDRYMRAFEALKETDSSTPTGSEVSSKTPEDDPGPAQGTAGSSTGPESQPHAAQMEQGNRDGSPHGTTKDSEIGAPITKTSTGSSGKHSHHRRSWEVVAESVRTHEYGSAFVPGGRVIKRETSTLLKPEKVRDKKSSSSRSQKKTRRASKNSP